MEEPPTQQGGESEAEGQDPASLQARCCVNDHSTQQRWDGRLETPSCPWWASGNLSEAPGPFALRGRLQPLDRVRVRRRAMDALPHIELGVADAGDLVAGDPNLVTIRQGVAAAEVSERYGELGVPPPETSRSSMFSQIDTL